MNRSKSLLRFAAAALVVFALAVAASAQVTTVSGKVFIKKADGTSTPLPGATVKFYRTDIKQEFEAKTDKSGRYVHAGLPLVGTFTVVISGPGAAPFYKLGFRAINNPESDATLAEGDGSTLTLADVAALEASKGKPTEGVSTAEAKKKAAEIAAERKRIEEENAKATEINAKAPDILKAGNEAFTAKNWDAAIAKYDEGIALIPEDPVFYRNKAVALFSRGLDKYNASVRVRPNDQAGIAAAREDMKNSTDVAEKAVSAQRAKSSSGAPAAGGAGQPNQMIDLLSTRAEAYRLALTTSTPVDNDAAAKGIEEYIDAETDPAKKDKAQSSLGDALFFAGRVDDAIAKYRAVLAKNPNNLDAMYGLGIALAAKASDATGAQYINEAHDMLQQFVAKAPEGYPRKQDAAASVKYLEETLNAPKGDSKSGKTTTKTRKP